MKPVPFEEQNTTYVAEGCGDLPVFKQMPQIISCFELTDEEIEKLKHTNKIWVSVHAVDMPPIWLGVDKPFRFAKEEEEEDE